MTRDMTILQLAKQYATTIATSISTTIATAIAQRPTSDKIVYVSTSGTDSNSGRALGLPFLTVSAALTSLGTSPGTVSVSAGTYSFSSTLGRYSGQNIIGSGRNTTTLSYTGTGTAITSATSGTRTYGSRLADFTLSTSTGAVGIDFDSLSTSACYEVTVSGFSDAGYRVRSVINGGAVYNNFFGCTAVGKGSGSTSIGFDVQPSGSNTANFFGCGARSNAIGLNVLDSNHVAWFGGAIESNNHGWVVESSTSALSDNATVAGTRFENNVTSNWKIGETTTTNVRNTFIIHPALVTFPVGDVESGNRLHKYTLNGISEVSSATAVATGAYRLERTTGGGSELPNMLLVDSNTATGTPVTAQINTERAGYFIRGTRGGTIYWDVDTSGNVRQPQGSYFEMKKRSDPSAPAADTARLYVKDNGAGKTQLVVRFPTGAVQVIATEP